MKMIDESRVKEIKLKAGMFAQMGGQDNLIFAECISDMLNDRKERIEIEKQKDKEIELLRGIAIFVHNNKRSHNRFYNVSYLYGPDCHPDCLRCKEDKLLKAYHDWKESNEKL
jgi:hypothetical protein